MLSLVVAVADNGVIGVENRLPWRAPADLARFKQLTMGKPIVMGRKTFESLGRVLPGRPHVVISRQALQLPENCHLVHSMEQAISKAETLVDATNEIMVIGGAEIYAQALPLADRVYLTRVHVQPQGDAFFSALDENIWQVVETQTAEGEPACTYVTYEKRYL